MKKNNQTTKCFLGTYLWLLLTAMLWTVSATKGQASDWMRRSDKFYMEYSGSTPEHMTLHVLMCDLDMSNTYAKSDGTIYATSGNTTYYLMDIIYVEEGSDENQYGKVKARIDSREAAAWFTNGYGQQEQQLSFETKEYLIQKWGSDNHYCTPSIDYYFPAAMAGKKWTFYFKYKHSNGSQYVMTLGTHTLSETIGLKKINTADFQCERTSPDKIKFTVPAMPDDVKDKMKDIHKHVGTYNLTFNYTLQDYSEKTVKEKVDCVVGTKKTYEFTIPEEVGNFHMVDLIVEATDALFDGVNYFWKETKTYNKSDIFQTVPVPKWEGIEYRQFDSALDLMWDPHSAQTTNYIENSVPYIYRVETDKNGEILSGRSWDKRGTLGKIGSSQTQSYTDKDVSQSTYYRYMVVNVPQEWIDNKSISSSELNSPSDKLLYKLGYAISDVTLTSPSMTIRKLQQDVEVKDKVRLTWEYTRVPVSANTVQFDIYRRQKGNTEWTLYGHTIADANPKSGTLASFTDNDLPNNSITFEYKVALSVNDGKDLFESDVVAAGLLSGTMITEITATKGSHESTVRVSWRSKQVGTDNTNFVLFRRYAGSTDDFMQIYTTTGHTDSYTFEDNTVQPGYLYEYKVEAHSGAQANTNNYQNSMSDVGFSQARGVISGRVTFGTGMAVEDVRLGLRASGDADDSAVRGFSQRIDGASTGIVWDVDEDTSNKLFSKEKDYTLQLFVRPDQDLAEGAVIGEIPHLGRLVLGSKQGDNYKLLLEIAGEKSVNVKHFGDYWDVKVFIEDLDAIEKGGVEKYYSEQYGTWVITTEQEKTKNIETMYDSGYGSVATGWLEPSPSGLWLRVFGRKQPMTEKVDISEHIWQGKVYDSGLSVPSNIFSLVSLQHRNGAYSVSVNDESKDIVLSGSYTTRDHRMIEDGTYNLPNGYYMFGENCLYKPNNVSQEKLMLFYKASYDIDIPNWFPDMATTIVNPEDFTPFSVGGGRYIGTDEEFKGHVTEVRVWDHSLTNQEKSKVMDRVMNGRETGLVLYWPMDEGLDHYVFDASYSNDTPNGRHATVGNNITSSTILPTEDQLSRYGLTDEKGEYIIRGIPFRGSGSTYTITPTKGIHLFNPQSRNGFIGGGSLVLNSYDFTDQSSFTVKGTVTYQNTNIPADSIQFKIDGNLAQTRGGLVVTDANGEYELSVPIGSHTIEAYKEGHKLTTFPLDGSLYEFKQDEIVNFFDQTLVNVTGRVNGGYSDMDEPLGFNLSTNRLGKAIVKLSLGKESQCSFNYIVNDRGEGSIGTENLPVESATTAIKSTAYRAGGSLDDTNYIYITTDAETGEFSAMLPPLKYKVESIRFDGGDQYDKLPVFAENLPFIDASKVTDRDVKKDSVEVNGEWQYYKYYGKMIRQYRANPTITVAQTGQKNGAFGESVITVTNDDYSESEVPVIKYTEKGYEYIYGKPLFIQNGRYEIGIDVSEDYVNLDSKKVFHEVPNDAVVSISNTASLSTTVYAEGCTVDGQVVPAGEACNVLNLDIKPDVKGHVIYQWIGGWPNLGKDHLRNLSISVKVDGHTVMWKAPDSDTDALDLILLGSLTSGTNFITKGPEKVDYVLRRPPGSTSDATLSTDTIKSMNWQHRWTTRAGSSGLGAYTSVAPTFELSEGVCAGTILMNHSKIKGVFNASVISEESWSDWEIADSAYTYKLTESVKTPNKLLYILNVDTYRADGGDTFIGRATNLQFGKGRCLNLYKQDDGTYQIDVKEAITIGESFGTVFVYPQSHIEEVLLPNLQMILREKLQHVNGDHWNSPEAKVVPGKVMYYTKYKEGDKEWGRSNADKEWTEEQKREAGGFPSYIMVDGTDKKDNVDEVSMYISSIASWENTIAMNEEDKLKAFNDSKYLDGNYSIAGGTSVIRTETITNKYIDGTKTESGKKINENHNIGIMLNEVGGYVMTRSSEVSKDQVQTDTTTTYTRTVSWMLSDSDPRSALTVDVYKSPLGWSPIFRTRGGQTVNPYAAATYTKQYKQGSLLDEATMRIEYPQLEVVGSSEISDVPTGGEARFKLEMTNLSETNSTCNYVLEVTENSNPDGAVLSMDGATLSNGYNGRTIKMAGGESINKTLVVKQGKRSVLDYKDILLVLRSEKDLSTHSDTVKLKVHFMPASAKVSMKVAHTVLNQKDYDTYKGFQVNIFDLDRQDAGLRGVRLQYRRKGTDNWNLATQWSLKKYMQQGDVEMPDGSSMETTVVFPDDGVYELRAQSFGTFAEAESSLVGTEVTYESDIVEVTQDRRGPKLLGMPFPENGLLTYDNRNNMHVRFNKELNENALSKMTNITIEGYLNNAIVDNKYHHDVGVQLNGDKIETEGTYLLSNSDIAFDMWFYRQGDGTIMSMGTENNLLSLYTHDNGKLGARVGDADHTYDTDVTLPENKWLYMVFSYTKKTADDSENRVTMAYADADSKELKYIGKNVPANALSGQGRISIGGNGMKGVMHDLTLWNVEKSVTELYETRDAIKAAYTPGLIGYWRMDEGHGKTVIDKARSRNMLMTDESWYINNRNLAAHIDGKEPLKIDISRINTLKTDNYALEMWFRGDKVSQNDNAQLLSLLNGISIGFRDGKLTLTKSERSVNDHNEEVVTVNSYTTLSDVNYIDNEWHHLALNVHRGSSAIAYVDGKAVKTIPEDNIPGMNGHYLVVGGEQTLLAADGTNGNGEGGVTNCLTGDVDDIRIWNAAIANEVIDEQRYERLNNTYSGLVGYYPMEDIHRIQSGTVTTDFSLKNFGKTEKPDEDEMAIGKVTQSVNAPALLPGSSRMRMDAQQFDITTSGDQIYFTFKDDALPQMDGNDFKVTVKDIKDEHGNISETVKWAFHADFAGFMWLGGDAVNIEKNWDETKTFQVHLYNNGNTVKDFELSGMPSWMTVTPTIGSITDYTRGIDITIPPTVPVGRYTEYIYATDKLGIKRALRIHLTVKGDEPNWSVDPSLYESNMTLTGQIYVGDKICEFTDSKIAAFDELGVCRGVAHPHYVSTRDAYYVDMIVYGGSATDISSGKRDITFKMYDASTGTVFPVVKVRKPDETESLMMTYSPDANEGSYDHPILFSATNDMLQTLSLGRGWTWLSVYVSPESTAIADVLPKSKTELKKFQNIKSKTAIATTASDGSAIRGTLEYITPGSMYKAQLYTPTTLKVIGQSIDVMETAQTINPGYNWIGSLSSAVMSPEEAFADLSPVKGDMVKTRNAVAFYNGKGVWEGTLQNIVPGVGYIYQSNATQSKSFHYPRIAIDPASARQESNRAGYRAPSHFEPSDESLYPDNMNIIAVVRKDGVDVEDAELGAFINNECRGTVTCINGYYFLTILGSSSDDKYAEVELRLFADGEEYTFDVHQSFISDAVLGTLEEPFVINLENCTDIRMVSDDMDDTEWYSLQGIKIGKRPTTPGVYLHHGHKVVIIRKR